MPQVTTSVEFDEKEVRELLIEAARKQMEKPSNGGVSVDLIGALHDGPLGPLKTLSAKDHLRRAAANMKNFFAAFFCKDYEVYHEGWSWDEQWEWLQNTRRHNLRAIRLRTLVLAVSIGCLPVLAWIARLLYERV